MNPAVPLILVLSVVGLVQAKTAQPVDTFAATVNKDLDNSRRQSRDTPLLGLGMMQLEAGRNEDALQTLRQALEYYKENSMEPAILLQLGRAFTALHERTLALDAFNMILERFPVDDLADDAQYSKALLEARNLVPPERLHGMLADFAYQDPLALDFDGLTYFVAFSGGYRLDGIDLALNEFRKTWQTFPASDKADDALMYEAISRSFLLGRRQEGIKLFDRLRTDYPASPYTGLATVAQAFLEAASGNTERAVELLDSVEPEDSEAATASFLAGYLSAYRLKRPRKALVYLGSMEHLSSDDLVKATALYHQAMVHFTFTHGFSECERLLQTAVDLLDPIDTEAAQVVHAGAAFLLQTVEAILAEKSIMRSRLDYALFFQSTGHAGRAEAELRDLLGSAEDPKLVARIQFELAVTLHDHLSKPDEARAILSSCVKSRYLSEDRRAEASFRLASLSERSELEAVALGDTLWASTAAKALARKGELDEKQREQVFSSYLSGRGVDDPSRAPVLKTLAEMFEKEGNFEQATECYARLATIWPKASEALKRVENKQALFEIQRHLSKKGNQPGDGPLLLALAKIYDKTGEKKKALQFFKRAERALRSTADHCAAAFELLKARLENARSTAHSLTLIDSFLEEVPKNSAEALEAMVLKASVLERRVKELSRDPKQRKQLEEQAAQLRRRLVSKGVDVAASSIILAEKSIACEDFEQALLDIDPACKLPLPDGGALLLKSEILEKLERHTQRRAVLMQIVRLHPETKEGRFAGRELRKLRLSRLEKTLGKLKDPGVLVNRLSAFLSDASDEDVKTAKTMLESLSRSLAKRGNVTDEETIVLGRALARAGSFSIAAGLLKKAASSGRMDEHKALLLKLEAAKALIEAKDGASAFALLKDLAPVLPEARLLMAQLQLKTFHDPEKARIVLADLIGTPGVPESLLAQAYIESADLIVPSDKSLDALSVTKSRIKLLREAMKKTGGQSRYLVARRLAVLLTQSGDFSKAVQVWTEAGHLAPDRSEALFCLVRSVESMIEARQFRRARKELNAALAQGIKEPDYREQCRGLLRKTAAWEQLGSLRKSLNWSDPENTKNMDTMLRMAALYIDPLRDFRRAESLLNQSLELFPSAGRRTEKARRMKSRLPLLRRLQAMEAGRLDEDELFRLARLYEEEAHDYARAAALYKRLVKQYPDSIRTSQALMYLLRLESLYLDDSASAEKHLALLLKLKSAPLYSRRLVAFVSLLAGRKKLARLRRKARAQKASVAELVELGEAAANEISDPDTVCLVLDRLSEKGKEGREQAFRLALLAASSLRPEGLLVPGGADALGFLEKAQNLASTPAERARAYLVLGSLQADLGAPARAQLSFRRAIDSAPSSAAAEEALFRSAEILEGPLNEGGMALAAYRRIAENTGSENLVRLASARADALENQLYVKDLEDRTTRDAIAKRSPSIYFHTAKKLQREHGDLKAALANFRAYIRLGKKPALIIQSYKAVADILVKLEQPREAIDALQSLASTYPEMIDREEILLQMAAIREANLADYDGALELYRKVSASKSPRRTQGRDGLKRVRRLKRELARAQRVGLTEGATREILKIREEFLRGRRKDYRGAVSALKELLAEADDPVRKAPIVLELGSILDEKLEDYEQAIEYYNQYLVISQNRRKKGDVLLRKGDLQATKLGLYEEALETYENLLETYFGHPRRVEVMLKVAELKESKLDRVQEAMDAYRVLAESYPRSGYDEKALMRLAHLQRTYYADFEGAMAAYRSIIERFPYGEWADDAQYYIARIYEVEQGDLVRAKEEYERLLSRYPTSPFTGRARDALIRIERR